MAKPTTVYSIVIARRSAALEGPPTFVAYNGAPLATLTILSACCRPAAHCVLGSVCLFVCMCACNQFL